MISKTNIKMLNYIPKVKIHLQLMRGIKKTMAKLYLKEMDVCRRLVRIYRGDKIRNTVNKTIKQLGHF